MTLLTVTEFQALTDSLGIQWRALRSLDATTPGGLILTGSGNNLDRVHALADAKLTRALIAAFDDQHDKSAAPWSPSKLWLTQCLQALNLAAVTGGIAAFLAANPTATVTQDFADALADTGGYATIEATRILDAKTRFGGLALLPPGAGTFTAGATLGSVTTIELVTATAIGGLAVGPIVVTAKKADDTTETLTVSTVAAGTARGTVVALGAGTYKAVTAITAGGGSRGEALVVRSTASATVRTPAP